MKPNRTYILLFVCLLLATLNAGYLSYRYMIDNHIDPSLVGTSICSFTETIDCDKVLSTPQARAFIVPNAILGLAFQVGCLIWLVVGYRMEPQYRRLVFWVLRAMLMLGAVFTFMFWYLLANLDFFCVLCPVNHVLIYISLFAVHRLFKQEPKTTDDPPFKPLILLAAGCIALFFALQIWWLIVYSSDVDLAFHLSV